MSLFEAKRYPAALAGFRRIVEQRPSDSQAMYMIGLCYENGYGVTKDHLAASAWYRQAWQRGNDTAYTRLSKLYLATIESRETPAPQGVANKGLSAGSTLSLLQGDLTPGHYEVTHKVLSVFGFTRNSISIVSDASQDPDLYDWGVPAAHAQTKNDAEGRTVETEQEAIENYRWWMKDLIRRMMNITPENPKTGLYLLGYLLHGIQDLAAHKGITDAQHSYETQTEGHEHDSDHERASVALASELSSRFMERLRERQPENFKLLASYGGGISLTGETVPSSEKNGIIRREGMNLSLHAYQDYEKLAKLYEKVKDQYPKKPWPVEQVFVGMLEWL